MKPANRIVFAFLTGLVIGCTSPPPEIVDNNPWGTGRRTTPQRLFLVVAQGLKPHELTAAVPTPQVQNLIHHSLEFSNGIVGSAPEGADSSLYTLLTGQISGDTASSLNAFPNLPGERATLFSGCGANEALAPDLNQAVPHLIDDKPDAKAYLIALCNLTDPHTAQSLPGGIEQALSRFAQKRELSNFVFIFVGLPFEQQLPPLQTHSFKNLYHRTSADNVYRFWLKKTDTVALAQFSSKLRKTNPDLFEIYTKQSTGSSLHYIRTFRSSEVSPETQKWAEKHHLRILERGISNSSPDVIAIPRHDGKNPLEASQKFLLTVWSPNLKDHLLPSNGLVTYFDLGAIVTRLMGLPHPATISGSSAPIDPYVIN